MTKDAEVHGDDLPTESSTKVVMRQWLAVKGVQTDLKADLHKISQAAANRKLYKTDELAKTLGHKVLRSPVAHS